MSTLMKDRINRPQSLYVPFRDIIQENPVLKPGEIVIAYEDSDDSIYLECLKVGDDKTKFGNIEGIMLLQPTTEKVEVLDGHVLYPLKPTLNRVIYDDFYDVNDEKYKSIGCIDLFTNFGLCFPSTNGFSVIDKWKYSYVTVQYKSYNNKCQVFSFIVRGIINFESYNGIDLPSGSMYDSLVVTTIDTNNNISNTNIPVTIKTELCQTQYYQFIKYHIIVENDMYTDFYKLFGDKTYFDINITGNL